MTEEPCYICGLSADWSQDSNLVNYYKCPRCGIYNIEEILKKQIALENTERSILSHVIHKRQGTTTLQTQEDINNILKNNTLPTPSEQANNLILFLGNELPRQSDYFRIKSSSHEKAKNIKGLIGIKIGTPLQEYCDLSFLIYSLEKQDIIKTNLPGTPDADQVSLTFQGWQKYEELKRSVQDSRKAFMAMEFYDKEKEKTKDYRFQKDLLPYLIPTVLQTGFKLTNPLADEPQAGNIHARLEVEIRASRFIIAELSHGNSGAYWEAGFARGLGKPVIYMYNREIGNKPEPHFDVGSDYVIFWDNKSPEEISKELKGIIRATISDAIMTDNIE